MIELKKSPVVFNYEEHTYHLGDRELQGITSTLIRRAFPDKYKDVDPEVLANAARKGHELHTAIEFYENIGDDKGDDRIKLYAKLKDDYKLTTLATEYLVSDEEHYASSIDLVLQNINGQLFLADIKTTYNLDKASTGLQLSIYKRLFELQNPGVKVDAIFAIWLPNRDHTIADFVQLSVVDDETIDELIKADLADKPYDYPLIPDDWYIWENMYTAAVDMKAMAEQHIEKAKEKMRETMLKANLSCVKTANCTVSYIPARKTKRFDSATFKKENADLYNSYMKETDTAEQVRVIQKKPKEVEQKDSKK